jgi:hypothetical protein
MLDEADVERGSCKEGREDKGSKARDHLNLSSGSLPGDATTPDASSRRCRGDAEAEKNPSETGAGATNLQLYFRPSHDAGCRPG